MIHARHVAKQSRGRLNGPLGLLLPYHRTEMSCLELSYGPDMVSLAFAGEPQRDILISPLACIKSTRNVARGPVKSPSSSPHALPSLSCL